MILEQHSVVAQLFINISSESNPQQNTTWPRIAYIPCSCGEVYEGETCHPLKVRLQEHYKAEVQGEIEKSGMERKGKPSMLVG